MHRGHRLLGLTADFTGVSATIAAPDGVLRAVSARYPVGCDGVHSAVRTGAGIAFPEASRVEFDSPWLSAGSGVPGR